MQLDGKTILITGSGTGVGRGVAIVFARHGANVVVCGRRESKLKETISLIEAEGGNAIAVPTDITQPDQVENLVKASREAFGQVDVLFNNATSFRSIAPVYEVDPDIWWNDVAVNLYGTLLMMRAVMPAMIARDEGVIINMTGGKPTGGSGYACGNVGIEELTRVTAMELDTLESAVLVFVCGTGGLVRSEITELQAQSPAGQKWIPSTREGFDKGEFRNPEDIGLATIEMLKAATIASRGKTYNPYADFSDWK